MSRCASSPSLVNSSSPEVFTSSRPTTIQRPLPGCGSRSNTVGRPSGSLRVVTSPTRLVIQQHLGLFRAAAQVERPAIEADAVGVRRPIAEHGDTSVDRHATIADPFFDAAPRAVPRAREQFLQAFTHSRFGA